MRVISVNFPLEFISQRTDLASQSHLSWALKLSNLTVHTLCLYLSLWKPYSLLDAGSVNVLAKSFVKFLTKYKSQKYNTMCRRAE